jgi:hypothetical protein
MSVSVSALLLGFLLLPAFVVSGMIEVYDTIPGAVLVDYADAGDGREYYASLLGQIYEVVDDGEPEMVVNFEKIFIQGELGLLTFELDTDFKDSNRMFVYHSVQEQNGDVPGSRRFTVLSRVTLRQGDDPEVCEIMRIEQSGWNHNGGDIELQEEGGRSGGKGGKRGTDVHLLLSLGDDAPQNGNGNAQDTSNIYGTVIRITPNREDCPHATDNYDIPQDNPFVGVLGAREEIYWYGFRNPWRMARDEHDRDIIYVGDVGQQRWEEIDICRLSDPGTNYGWELFEGDNCVMKSMVKECKDLAMSPDYRRPVYDYPHFPQQLRPDQKQLGFSLSLGHIYTGSIREDLIGKMLMGDFAAEQIWAIDPIVDASTGLWTGAELVVEYAGPVVTIRKNSIGESIILALGEEAYVFSSL